MNRLARVLHQDLSSAQLIISVGGPAPNGLFLSALRLYNFATHERLSQLYAQIRHTIA
jgi:hypothetical protein